MTIIRYITHCNLLWHGWLPIEAREVGYFVYPDSSLLLRSWIILVSLRSELLKILQNLQAWQGIRIILSHI